MRGVGDCVVGGYVEGEGWREVGEEETCGWHCDVSWRGVLCFVDGSGNAVGMTVRGVFVKT